MCALFCRLYELRSASACACRGAGPARCARKLRLPFFHSTEPLSSTSTHRHTALVETYSWHTVVMASSSQDIDSDDDDDFASLFEDFNDISAGNLALQISSNLRSQVGLETPSDLAGNNEESLITWQAPKESGLQNSQMAAQFRRTSAEEMEEQLWAELVREDEEEGKKEMSQLSSNLQGQWNSKAADATSAIQTMDDNEAKETADIFDRLAAHGSGHVVLDLQEFKDLLLKLAEDEKGRSLLNLLLYRQKAAATVRSASKSDTPKITRRAETQAST
jgi:hypothetical protein